MKLLIIPVLAAVTLILAGCSTDDSPRAGTAATGAGGTGAGGATGGGAGSGGMGTGGAVPR